MFSLITLGRQRNWNFGSHGGGSLPSRKVQTSRIDTQGMLIAELPINIRYPSKINVR